MNLVYEDIIEQFFLLTKKDLTLFLNRVKGFLENDYQGISNFFSGRQKEVPEFFFKNFTFLKEELEVIFELFRSNSTLMKDSRWWELLEVIEEIDNRFKTLENINRWSRSSATNFSYSPTVQLDYTLLENQTLEGVAKSILERKDFQDSWFDVASQNSLDEEDYTGEGGEEIKLQLDRNLNLNITVNSVVDTLIEKSIYGKDLHKKLRWVEDINGFGDLEVLGYDATISQTVDILINLKKNDHPDYPNLGLQTNVTVGGNRASLNFPIIVRQLSEVFNSDDSLKNFQIKTLDIKEDNLSIDYQVLTRLNEVITNNEI